MFVGVLKASASCISSSAKDYGSDVRVLALILEAPPPGGLKVGSVSMVRSGEAVAMFCPSPRYVVVEELTIYVARKPARNGLEKLLAIATRALSAGLIEERYLRGIAWRVMRWNVKDSRNYWRYRNIYESLGRSYALVPLDGEYESLVRLFAGKAAAKLSWKYPRILTSVREAVSVGRGILRRYESVPETE